MESEIREIQVACFRLGEDIYAVDIMRIREIIRPLKLAALPRAPLFVEGVVNLRGDVIPVLDLRKRFAMPVRELDQNSRLLIVALAGRTLGIVVDEVTEVITVPVAHIKPPPQVTHGLGAEYLIGVCLVQDDLVMLLDPDRLLNWGENFEPGGVEATEELSGGVELT
jgi:purine-binding chemotaxis protein CheW